MTSVITIDTGSPIPPFEQLRVQLLEQVRSGILAPGSRLPTVRRLADDLGLAPGTVARAYRELESNGVIEGRGRHGTFVSSHGSPVERRAQDAAAEYAAQIRELGIAPSVGLSLASRALGLG